MLRPILHHLINALQDMLRGRASANLERDVCPRVPRGMEEPHLHLLCSATQIHLLPTRADFVVIFLLIYVALVPRKSRQYHVHLRIATLAERMKGKISRQTVSQSRQALPP